MHRYRDLLNLCRDADRCYLAVPGVCTNRDYVPAHSNLQRHGRGYALKSHDCFAFPSCPPCHHWLDYGTTATREEKENATMRALEEWTVYIWTEEKVSVT